MPQGFHRRDGRPVTLHERARWMTGPSRSIVAALVEWELIMSRLEPEPTSPREVVGDRGSRLLVAADVVEIGQVVLAEREAHAHRWWRHMASCYHDDAEVMVGWFRGSAADFIDDCRALAERGVLPVMRTEPVVVHVNGPRAVASLAVTIEVPWNEQAELSAYLRLYFQVESRHEAWRIASLRGVHEHEVIRATIPDPRASSESEGAGLATRLLEHFRERGLPVDPELLGACGTERTGALHREVFGWAGLEA